MKSVHSKVSCSIDHIYAIYGSTTKLDIRWPIAKKVLMGVTNSLSLQRHRATMYQGSIILAGGSQLIRGG